MTFTFKLSKRLARLKSALRATRVPAASTAVQSYLDLAVVPLSLSLSTAVVTVTLRSFGNGHARRALPRNYLS